jgi:acetyltransferase-like isoleucine patch superfamily enzyme
MNLQSEYSIRIRSRSKFRFVVGLVPRLKSYIINYFIVRKARKNGAQIGKYVTMPYKLAKRANANLIIGDHTSIQTNSIDLRSPVKIGSYVIIGAEVDIMTCSHNIDATDWSHKSYGLEIEDYCWLATKVFVLPSCRKIGKGAVCAAGSVVVTNIETMSVVSGNPAMHLKYRKNTHTDLVVESLLGNDLLQYIKTYTSSLK